MSSLNGYVVKPLKFLVVGLSNTFVIYSLYLGFIYVGLHYNLALTLDYLLGVITGYLMNRYWTFSSRTKTRYSLFRYCITIGVVYLINLIILNLLIGFDLMGPVLGQLVALGIAASVSFLLQNFWVFERGAGAIQQLDW